MIGQLYTSPQGKQYIHIDTDDPVQFRQLKAAGRVYGGPKAGCRKREPGEPGLVGAANFDDEPDKLADPADYKQIITDCREKGVFPEFHQTHDKRGWISLLKGNWNQNGLNYCWNWSFASCYMDAICRVLGKPILIAPNGLGGDVGWQNKGNYLESALLYAIEQGTPSAKYIPEDKWHSLRYRDFDPRWEEDRENYKLRLEDAWQALKSKMIQHCVTGLQQANSGYIAYYWWGHALGLIGLEWDETVLNNLAWIIRNSHNEELPLRLTGSRAVPDECWFIQNPWLSQTVIDYYTLTA